MAAPNRHPDLSDLAPLGEADRLISEVRSRGWATLKTGETLATVAQAHEYVDGLLRLFGTPVRARRQTGPLQAMSPAEAHPASLSAAFGLGKFPLHTDTAHWAKPARYLALLCMRAGEIATETQVLDMQQEHIVSDLRDHMRQSLFFVHGGRTSFYSAALPLHGEFLRYDPGCMEALNLAGRQVVEWFMAAQANGSVQKLSLRDGDLLVVDNWRVLHARGPVLDRSRQIVRGLAT